MAAPDTYHDAVVTALVKDGWTITDDSLFIKSRGIDLLIELGAENIVGAEKDGKKIAIEIKSLVGTSAIAEFHTTVGQFENYRLALEDEDPDRMLYVAIPITTFESFFTIPFVQHAVRKYDMALLVFDPEGQEIKKWQI